MHQLDSRRPRWWRMLTLILGTSITSVFCNWLCLCFRLLWASMKQPCFTHGCLCLCPDWGQWDAVKLQLSGNSIIQKVTCQLLMQNRCQGGVSAVNAMHRFKQGAAWRSHKSRGLVFDIGLVVFVDACLEMCES